MLPGPLFSMRLHSLTHLLKTPLSTQQPPGMEASLRLRQALVAAPQRSSCSSRFFFERRGSREVKNKNEDTGRENREASATRLAQGNKGKDCWQWKLQRSLRRGKGAEQRRRRSLSMHGECICAGGTCHQRTHDGRRNPPHFPQ